MPSIIRGSDSFDSGVEYGIGGDGYAWVDEAANRAVGTTYTNTTGKAIVVLVSTTIQSNSVGVNGVVDGITISNMYNGSSQSDSQSLILIVPDMSSYEIAASSGAPSIQYWSELKYTRGA